MSLHEGMRGERPNAEFRRKEETRTDAKGVDGGRAEGKTVANDDDARENADEGRRGSYSRAHLRPQIGEIAAKHVLFRGVLRDGMFFLYLISKSGSNRS